MLPLLHFGPYVSNKVKLNPDDIKVFLFGSKHQHYKLVAYLPINLVPSSARLLSLETLVYRFFLTAIMAVNALLSRYLYCSIVLYRGLSRFNLCNLQCN